MESFGMGVVVNVVANVIAAAILYLLGAAVGVLPSTAALWAVAVLVALTGLLSLGVWLVGRRTADCGRLRGWQLSLIAVTVLGLIAALYVAAERLDHPPRAVVPTIAVILTCYLVVGVGFLAQRVRARGPRR